MSVGWTEGLCSHPQTRPASPPMASSEMKFDVKNTIAAATNSRLVSLKRIVRKSSLKLVFSLCSV